MWGAVIPRQMEPEGLGLSIPGLGTGWGVLCRLNPGLCRGVSRTPCVSRGDILFPLHPAPWRGSQQGIFPSFPQQFHGQICPKTEFPLLLGRGTHILCVCWGPVSSAKPKGISPGVPRLCCPWDGIPRFHPEVPSRTSLWRAAGVQGMETLGGTDWGKKKEKNYQ